MPGGASKVSAPQSPRPGSSLRPCTDPCARFWPHSCGALDGSVCLRRLVLCPLLPSLGDVSCPLDARGPAQVTIWVSSGLFPGNAQLPHRSYRSGGPSAVKTPTCTSEAPAVSGPLSSPSRPPRPLHKVASFLLSAPHPPTLCQTVSSPSRRSHARNRRWRSSWPRACRTRRPRWTLCRGPCRRRRLCLRSGPSCWPNRRPWRGRSSSQLRRQLTSGTQGPTSRSCPRGLRPEEPGVRQGVGTHSATAEQFCPRGREAGSEGQTQSPGRRSI